MHRIWIDLTKISGGLHYNCLSKKLLIFRVMNCHSYIANKGRTGLIPMGSKELRTDYISKKSVRWNKTFKMNDQVTVNEAGTFLSFRGGKLVIAVRLSHGKKY